MLVLCIPVLAYLFTVGNTSLPDCGCPGYGPNACVANTRSEVRDTFDRIPIGQVVVLLLCFPGSYAESLDFSDFIPNTTLTILVDNNVVDPVFLNPSTLANPFFPRVTFGNTKYPSKQIEFLKDDDNMTQELTANVVEFAAEGLDVCRLRTNLSIFQTLSDAERFLVVNPDLPNVTIREQFCELHLFDDNVSVVPCDQQQAVYVNESIGSANLTFDLANTGVKVFGGTGRASLSLTGNIPALQPLDMYFFQGPESDLKIRNTLGEDLNIHIQNRDAAYIRYYGGGRVKLLSDAEVNCTVELNLTLLFTYLEFDTSIELYIDTIGVNKTATLVIKSGETISVGNVVIGDGSVFGFSGSANFGSVNVGEKGVFQCNKEHVSYGPLHIEIDSLYVNAGVYNTTAAIQIMDFSRVNPEPSIFLDRIGTLHLNLNPMFDSYVWAQWSHSKGYGNNSLMSQLSENITPAEKNLKLRLLRVARWDYDCSSSYCTTTEYTEVHFIVDRFEFGLDNTLLCFFVMTGIVHLACGIPLVVWAVKNIQLLFE